MPRLLVCPSCRRHVQATEHDCPFCGHLGLTTAATSTRLSALLLGLCLAGCASAGTDDASKADDKGSKADTPEPEPEPEPLPEPALPEPTDTSPPIDTNGPDEPEPNDTAVVAPDPQPVEGTDAGEGIDDPPKPSVDTPQKTKYGGPRPAKKYGAPPKPGPDDLGF